jgi:WD40 repeat protein
LGDFQPCPGRVIDESKVVQTYNKHRCDGYSVSAKFINNEQQIITGSEDKKVYIYCTETAEVVKTLSGHSNVVHLVDVQHSSSVVSSTIDNVSKLRTPSDSSSFFHLCAK